jgi:hypothetical protein
VSVASTVITTVVLAVTLGPILWLGRLVNVLAKEEARAWLPHISKRTVRQTALALPPEQRDILEAWEAELDEYADRPLSMLAIALRITRDRKRIAREMAPVAQAEGIKGSAQARDPRLLGARIIQSALAKIRGTVSDDTAYRFKRLFTDQLRPHYGYMAAMVLTCALVALPPLANASQGVQILTLVPSAAYTLKRGWDIRRGTFRR